MLNSMYANEQIPSQFSESITAMLHKKGSINDPINFRPITLTNTISKIFTQLLAHRLENWANINGILPECQAGFRKGRGCRDHIFTLNGLIQHALQKKGGGFIAFK